MSTTGQTADRQHVARNPQHRSPTSKVERLMNLVIALLSTRNYITAERIRANRPGLRRQPRTRRSRGCSNATRTNCATSASRWKRPGVLLDPTEGYRINRDAYALPPIELTADEAAAVAVATQLWQSPGTRHRHPGRADQAAAAGVDVDPTKGAPCPSRSSAGMPGCAARRTSGNPVGGHRLRAGRAVSAPRFPPRAVTTRTVEPWAVITDRGRWYLVVKTATATRSAPSGSRASVRRYPDRRARRGDRARRRRPAATSSLPRSRRRRPGRTPRCGWLRGAVPCCDAPGGSGGSAATGRPRRRSD